MPEAITQEMTLREFAQMFAQFAGPAAAKHMRLSKDHAVAAANFQLDLILDSKLDEEIWDVETGPQPDKEFIREFGESLTVYLLHAHCLEHVGKKRATDKLIPMIGNFLAPQLYAVAALASTGAEIRYSYFCAEVEHPTPYILNHKPRLWIHLPSHDSWMEMCFRPHDGYLTFP